MDTSNITLENIIKFIKDNNYLDKSMIEDIEHDDNKKNNEKKLILLQYGNSANFESISPKIDKVLGIFYKTLSHVGVIRDLDSQNVSLYFSVLFCIDSDFRMKTIDLQLEYINQFHQYIVNNLNESCKSREEKKNIMNDLKAFNNSDNIINILARCFTINIWVIDSEKEIISVSNNDMFDENRKNIILIKHEKYHEPIIYDSNYYFDSSIKLVKSLMDNVNNINNITNNSELWEQNLKLFIPSRLLNNISFSEIAKDTKDNEPEKVTVIKNEKTGGAKKENVKKSKKISCIDSEKINTIETNINELTYGEKTDDEEDVKDINTTIVNAMKDAIEEDKNETSESDDDSDTDSESDKEQKNKGKKVSKNKKECNTRMKLEEIQNIAKKYKIDINKKGSTGKMIRKTKMELIEEINNI